MTAITRYIEDQRLRGHPINPKTMHFRLIAAQLSKRYNIPFNLKESRKRKDVIEWLDQHWQKVGKDCLISLRNIESIFHDSEARQAVSPGSDSSDGFDDGTSSGNQGVR
jgi:hypothetical protein